MKAIKDLPALERLKRARAALITGAPFFGALALSMELVEQPSIGTMAVDGKHCFYAPEFVASLSEPELIGVKAHEVCHVALMHHVRRGRRDPSDWNIAADIAVNSMVLDAGFVLPKSAIVDRSYDGMGAEEIYATRALAKSQQQGDDGEEESDATQEGEEGAPGPGDESSADDSGDDDSAAPGTSEGEGEGMGAAGDDGTLGNGGGGDAAPDPARCGGVLDAAADASGLEQAAAETESMVRQAIAVAASQAGELPGHLKRFINELNKARVDWHDVYDRFIDDASTRAVDWSRPNKRFLDSGFILPSTKPDSVECVAMAIDTSGSINDDVLSTFAAEAQATLDSGRVERIYVVYCDSAVQGTQEFIAGDIVKLEPEGGGGTSFKPALAHIGEHCPEAACIVYLTDLEGWGDCWGDEPEQPVLWTVWGGRTKAPFGEVIALDPYA